MKMGNMKGREVRPLPEAEALFRQWFEHLDGEFTRQQSPDRRAEIVRDEMYQIYTGKPLGGKMTTSLISEAITSAHFGEVMTTFAPQSLTI